ncbi:CHAD domain-containing protein [Streptomyces sp. NPDC096311]|uniref:CHAD domain-containing protein n=1 Tax=Streptomyces sp. NPDC096311 TaxID=3366083 RepID=UPI0037FB47EE
MASGAVLGQASCRRLHMRRDLALCRTRGVELRPVVRIRSTRSTQHLVDSEGAVLAELSLDKVRAESLLATATPASWTEVEVELAEDADPLLLDLVDEVLRKKGIDRASSPSKLSRALEETGTGAWRLPDARAEVVVSGSAAEEVLRYVDGHVHALVDLDPAVRRGLPDSVHRMRVTCRRPRSTLRSYRAVLERQVTDPIHEEPTADRSRSAGAWPGRHVGAHGSSGRTPTPPTGWSRHGVRHGSATRTGCAPHGPRLAAAGDSTC